MRGRDGGRLMVDGIEHERGGRMLALETRQVLVVGAHRQRALVVVVMVVLRVANQVLALQDVVGHGLAGLLA